ncbi:MAG TPA: hypothetical protein V6D22_17940, partial [Candidatus Obscuribacterales bacterium]
MTSSKGEALLRTRTIVVCSLALTAFLAAAFAIHAANVGVKPALGDVAIESRHAYDLASEAFAGSAQIEDASSLDEIHSKICHAKKMIFVLQFYSNLLDSADLGQSEILPKIASQFADVAVVIRAPIQALSTSPDVRSKLIVGELDWTNDHTAVGGNGTLRGDRYPLSYHDVAEMIRFQQAQVQPRAAGIPCSKIS